MNIQSQIAQIKRGTVDFIGEEELVKKLSKGTPLKIKFGADPSAPDLHLGHLVVLRKLKVFQDLGHEIIFLIGDFTAMIGDPSGKSETRRPLLKEIIVKNAETYKEQIFKVLDHRKTKIVYNSDWLKKMDLQSVMRLMSEYTVARMLERADFKDRFKNNKEISIIEFLYPLLQGYDSVELKADVEVGGHDQIFNLLVGREFQKSFGIPQQTILTMPLLEGLDGKMKMSKSLNNYIAFKDTPKDIFGKIMSLPDKLLLKYYELLTDIPLVEIKEMEKGFAAGVLNPKDSKMQLAQIITSFFYGESDAKNARDEFEAVFKNKQLPQDIPLVKINKEDAPQKNISIAKLLFLAKLVPSTSEAKRTIKAGAVKVDDVKVLDENLNIDLVKEKIVSVGKRKYVKIICE